MVHMCTTILHCSSRLLTKAQNHIFFVNTFKCTPRVIESVLATYPHHRATQVSVNLITEQACFNQFKNWSFSRAKRSNNCKASSLLMRVISFLDNIQLWWPSFFIAHDANNLRLKLASRNLTMSA